MAEKPLTPLQALSTRMSYNQIKPLGDLAGRLRAEAVGEPSSNGHRGVTVSLLNSALGSLDGGLAETLPTLPFKDPARHLFLWLVTGRTSSKDLTRAQLQTLYSWMQDTGNQEAARLAVITAAKHQLYPREDETMSEQILVAEAVEVPTTQGQQPQAQSQTSEPVTHTEAPLSATAKLFDANGIDWLVTVRAGADGRSFVKFLDVLNSAGAYALSHGFSLTNPNATVPTVAATAPAAAAATPAAAPPAVAPQANGNGGEQAFPATEMVATVNEGKVFWKVKGGSFGNFGISVWPEVLTAAGLVDLNPMQTYNLAGWIAYWTADSKGRKKITRLVRQ